MKQGSITSLSGGMCGCVRPWACAEEARLDTSPAGRRGWAQPEPVRSAATRHMTFLFSRVALRVPANCTGVLSSQHPALATCLQRSSLLLQRKFLVHTRTHMHARTGWKMKLALARAMLLHADILLLDEPTNHLDTTNVAWLVNYLRTQPGITAMIVSHDSAFLDHVCTDIFHYESRKLKRYRGNLSEFVKVGVCLHAGVEREITKECKPCTGPVQLITELRACICCGRTRGQAVTNTRTGCGAQEREGNLRLVYIANLPACKQNELEMAVRTAVHS
eukprot:1161835-Pelagomonas_calceolata.AAC.8